jgi:hypothetical protein
MLELVDDYIGDRVHAMERRVNRFNVGLTVVSMLGGGVLGWILSAVQGPGILLRVFIGH